jgi:hypothetical protein
LQGFLGVLLHFSFGFKKDGAIFCAMLGFTSMVHTIRRLQCVRVSLATVASAWHAPSMAILIWYVIKGPMVSLLWGWPEILFLVLQGPIAVGVNAVYLLGVATLIIIVASCP